MFWHHRHMVVTKLTHVQSLNRFFQEVIQQLRDFPWKLTLRTLKERLREDKLGQAAGSLAFSTLIALVPLFTVILAIVSFFPMFGNLETLVDRWLVQSLVPETIAKPVLKYLRLFSAKAGGLGWAGALILLASAISVMITIERKLNEIWRVRRRRPWVQRLLMLWAGLTLGPVLLVVSIGTSTALFGAKSQWVWIGTSIPFSSALDVLEWLLVIAGLMGLYKWVPYTQVRWSHAFVSALLATLVLQVVKQLLTWYMSQVPSVSVLYGTFSVLPVLFIWTFFAWLVVLWGGVVAAYLPSMMSGVHRVSQGAGWDFRVALEILQALHGCQVEPGSARATTLEELSQQLQLDLLQMEPAYEALVDVGWVGALDEDEQRVALLIDPNQQVMAPLVQRLLIERDPTGITFWNHMPWQHLRLVDVLTPSLNGL